MDFLKKKQHVAWPHKDYKKHKEYQSLVRNIRGAKYAL